MGKKEEDKAIEELLRGLMGKDPFEEVKKNPLHVNTVASTLEQYLTPFICFGYDVNGDAVVLSNAQTQRDIDGLMISIGRYMAQARMGQMNDDIGDMLDE
jgi:hypothetical protein